MMVVWYRSLYWRIAVGFILFVAAVLAAQGLVFLWLVERSTRSHGPPLTSVLGGEVSAALETNPSLDLEAYAKIAQFDDHVFVIMADGRVMGSRTPGASIVSAVISDLNRTGLVPDTWRSSQYQVAPVVVRGTTTGVVGIVPRTTVEQYGWTMAAIGLGLLVMGTVLLCLLISGPARRRIHSLADAAQRFGSGDFSIRAVETGGDEIAELACAFNGMADELASRASELVASDRARRQLVADVSHELMTPLTAVLGHLETLMMTEVRLDAAARQRYLAVASREAHRLERLIGDLLDAARLEAGGGDLDLQQVAVEELFSRVIGRHEYECHTRNIRLTQSIAPEATSVTGDSFRLDQALENITANALHHTQDGGTIHLAADRSDGTVILSVTDSGEGIAPEHLPLVFDRFYKAQSSRSRGSGLGLSIVKAIAVRHGGRVTASSTLGRGTTIRLELPTTSRQLSVAILGPDHGEHAVGR